MNKELVLSGTKKVIKVGTGLGIVLTKEMVHALEIAQGSLLKITIQNTGIVMEKRNLKETPEAIQVE